MRAIIITTSYPRFVGDAGGHFVEAQALRLAASGYQVDVVAPGRRRAIEERAPIRVHWFGGARGFGWPGVAARFRDSPLRAGLDLATSALWAPRSITRLLSTGRHDTTKLVAHWLVPSVWPWLGGVPRSLELEAHAHGGDVRLLRRMPMRLRLRVVEKIVDRASVLRFASSSLLGELLSAIDEPHLARELRRRAEVAAPDLSLPVNGLEPEQRIARRRSLGVGAGEPMALALGRLVPDKCFEVAIDAVAQHGCAHLVVVGDGPSRQSLEARARRLGARVTFLGQLDREEALRWLASADVLLHPSRAEAAPTVVREARLLDVDVVACEVGDVARWAASDARIRCVERSSNAFATELASLGESRRS